MKRQPFISFITLLTLCVLAMSSCDRNKDSLQQITLDCADIVADKTLEKAEYTINCDIAVRNGAVLTIEAGSIFKFASSGSLSTSNGGAIKAIGNENEQIVFTGTEPIKGFWKGIMINSHSLNNVFEYCVFEYGGKNMTGSIGAKGLATVCLGRFDHADDEARAVFTNCTFSHGGNSGIFVNVSSTMLGSGQNKYIDNDEYPIWASFEAVSDISGDNTYSGNSKNMVYVESPDYNINKDIVFNKTGVPYYLNHTLGDPLKRIFKKVSIFPGVELRMGANMMMFVVGSEASFYCVGNASERIKINGGEAVKGYWDKIRFGGTASADNRIEYTDFSDGGNFYQNVDGDKGMVTIGNTSYGGATIKITNTSFSNSPHHAIHLYTCATSTVNGMSGAAAIKSVLLGSAAGNSFINVDEEQVVTID